MTAEVTLAEYWGDDWDVVRLAMEGDFDLSEVRAKPEPWSEVKDQVLDHLRPGKAVLDGLLATYAWPKDLTSDKLRQLNFRFEVELDEMDLGEVDKIAGSFERPIAEAVHIYFELLQNGVEQVISSGLIRKGPFFLPDTRTAPEEFVGVTYQGVAGFADWSAGYRLYESDFPELAEQQRMLAALKRQRAKEIQEYLGAR